MTFPLTDLVGDVTVSGPGGVLIGQGDGRIRTSELMEDGDAYERVLYFSPLSAADMGVYRCTGSIIPRVANPLVTSGQSVEEIEEIRVFGECLGMRMD